MKKPEIKFLLSCDQAVVDQANKLSLIGIFENIDSPVFPASHPIFFIVTQYGVGEGTFTIQSRLLAPSKERVLASSKARQISFKGDHKHNDLFRIVNMLFEAPGVYWLEALLDGKTVSCEPLTLSKHD